jgi:hypothetical protein
MQMGRKKAPPERGFGLHAVMTAVHLVMVTPAVHGHRLARGASVHAAAGRRLARGWTARLRASASGTAGGLCNCERAGQSEGRGQDHRGDFHPRFLKAICQPREQIKLDELGSYFFRTPVSVLLRLFTAPFAAGVLTAADDGPVLGLVWFAPRLFPVVPWFRALDVLEPGAPPVPLIVAPFESEVPAELLAAPELAAPPALPPEAAPEVCAHAMEKLAKSRLTVIANSFMTFPRCTGNQ